MGIVRPEDMAAYWVGRQLVCAECLRDDDDFESVVTQDEVENSEDLYYCDRCKKRIE